MIILGVDPGLANNGYGLVRYENRKLFPVKHGCITTSKANSFVDRIKVIHYEIKELIMKYNPQEVAIEDIFFNKNTKTALAISKVYGSIALTVSLLGLNLFEYTPLQIKQAMVGNGRADKFQVQSMVKILLNLEKIPRPDHAADALAAAICHLHTRY